MHGAITYGIRKGISRFVPAERVKRVTLFLFRKLLTADQSLTHLVTYCIFLQIS